MGTEMNNKIFIGSIIVVVVLVMVSFTSVIGYHSVESEVKATPLFNTRTSIAIGEESKNNLVTNYIGKGNEDTFNFLVMSRAILRQKIIQKIKAIDDNIFEKILSHALQGYLNSDYTPPEILEALYIMKDETDKAVYQEKVRLDTVLCQTLNCHTVNCNTVLNGCLAYRFYIGIIKLLDSLYSHAEQIPIFNGIIIKLLYDILRELYQGACSAMCNQCNTTETIDNCMVD